MARQPLDLFLSHCRNINPFGAAFSCRGRAERCREAFRAGCSKGSFEFLKTQKANNSKASQSPWNWPDGLDPSFLMLTKAVSTLLRGHLEEAKASKAFWKRHFQPVRRPDKLPQAITHAGAGCGEDATLSESFLLLRVTSTKLAVHQAVLWWYLPLNYHRIPIWGE